MFIVGKSFFSETLSKLNIQTIAPLCFSYFKELTNREKKHLKMWPMKLFGSGEACWIYIHSRLKPCYYITFKSVYDKCREWHLYHPAISEQLFQTIFWFCCLSQDTDISSFIHSLLLPLIICDQFQSVIWYFAQRW